ncbi:MAG: AMIN domain-containing protein [Cyanobacteria bacterium J06626_18]
MKRLLGYGSCLAGGALLALAAQPVHAAATVITGIEVIPTDQGAQIVLETQAGDTPQVFAVNQGNSLRADIVRTELQLTEGAEFIQQDPAPGISTISLVPLDSNSVRLTVDGAGQVPMGTVAESSGGGIVIDVAAQGNAAPQASTPLPEEIPTVPGPVAQADDETDVPEGEVDAPEGEVDAPEGDTPEPEGPEPDVLFPEPEVIIDGVNVPGPTQQQVAPPFLPAAVPPPVGDIAISEVRPDFGEVDLGTVEVVPRLVLREAPSREVLTLLARAADLNVVFVDAAGEEGAGDGEGPPVTLDIENETVQSVFNSVLRVTGLQANRVGRSIYVGPQLPNAASDVVVRTLRLNQIDVPQASNFLVGLGAERAVSREREVTTVTATEIAEGLEGAQETQAETFTEEVLDVDRVDFQDSIPIFRGLQVVAEERTNSITLVGTPAIVELATAQLVRLDLRKRQVAINVKVIDIDLNALDAFGTSFSFEIGDVGVSSQGGVGVINFGRSEPAGPTGVPNNVPIPSVGFPNIAGGNGLLDAFLLQLTAVVEEGNAKILTDPTLIVQEGQSASVQLTEEIVAEFESDIEVPDSGDPVVTIDVETEPAGLILQIDVERIDDNGFVSLSVAPSISAPVDQFAIPISGVTEPPFITLLSERQLNSGLVRVRDGQTLVLSGIIQETDRVSTAKVPILGDLPILGALFRSTIRENTRNELIVVLTPEILDDSDQSAFGYNYTPSEEVQNILDGINGEE